MRHNELWQEIYLFYGPLFDILFVRGESFVIDITQDYVETIFAVLTGIGLSAACGFRVFVPLLALNLASRFGYVNLASGFEWIGGNYAAIAFSLAAALEIIAYYVPWLDNIMDAIASPVCIIAGTIATASVITEMPPSLKWIVSIIAGGGIAGVLQGGTVALRTKSSLFTGGAGNVAVATLELAGSVITSILSILLPAIAFIIAAAFAVYCLLRAGRVFFRKMKGSS
jgi:hypothetical protein